MNVGGEGVDIDSFCNQPEVFSCKVIMLAFDTLCPPEQDGMTGAQSKVDFDIYVLLLSKFSPRTPVNEKIKFLYTCLTNQGTNSNIHIDSHI